MAKKHLKILELFSGIGGMHTAAVESQIPFEIVGSFEINPTALQVYMHNFPKMKSTKNRNIMSLTVDELDSMAPDIIMMSPPCQPFTRTGLKRDVDDNRSNCLLHILNLLDSITVPPAMILLENVMGFEQSQARDMLLQVLKKRQYDCQEFLLSPLQFKIPNSRLRYYMLAKQTSNNTNHHAPQQILAEIPACICFNPEEITDMPSEECSQCQKKVIPTLSRLIRKYFENFPPLDHSNLQSQSTYKLNNYLELDSDMVPYLLKDRLLNKYGKVLDIVNIESNKCCCFTKGYGHYVQGTGSVIQQNLNVSLSDAFSEDNNITQEQRLEKILQLKLRYFSSKEILNLMCFPHWFTMPNSTTLKQNFRVLGNSINVLVVTMLLILLVNK